MSLGGGGHRYPCFRFLVMSLFCRGECNVHSLRSTSGATHADLLVASVQQSLPHMCGLMWDLSWIQTRNHLHSRRTRYHCASDPANAHFEI